MTIMGMETDPSLVKHNQLITVTCDAGYVLSETLAVTGSFSCNRTDPAFPTGKFEPEEPMCVSKWYEIVQLHSNYSTAAADAIFLVV